MKQSIVKIGVFVTFLLCSPSIWGEVNEHTKLWTNAQITGSFKKDSPWNYYLEPQLRFVDDAYKFNAANVYAGIYYQINPTVSAWFGLYRNDVKHFNGDTTQENRVWEQIDWNALTYSMVDLSRVDLTSRSRLEQRKRVNESTVANRFREKITLRIPFTCLKDYYFVVADEIFLQLNQPNWVPQRVFSQNRASLGVQIPINKQAKYEVGYLNQYQYTQPNQMSNVLYITLMLNVA